MKTVLVPAIVLFLVFFVPNSRAVNTIAVNPATYSVNENTGQVGVVVLLTRDVGDPETVTVKFDTADGTAKVGSDYFGASGTLTFAPNESAKLVQISIINDFISEPSETFVLNLSSAVNATITAGQAIITIVDDDGSANGINVVEFSSAEYGTVETLGPGQGQAVITLILNAQRKGRSESAAHCPARHWSGR